jgi:hypothetical protein
MKGGVRLSLSGFRKTLSVFTPEAGSREPEADLILALFPHNLSESALAVAKI